MTTLTTNISIPANMSQELKFMRNGFRLMNRISPDLSGRIALRMFLTPRRRQQSSNAQQIMSQAEKRTIRHGSRNLATYVWPNSGPTILLVHGWESNASGMRGFVRPLLKQGFRVVAYDAPAHGHSQGKQTNIVDLSGALQSIVGEFGPVYGIVSHSFAASTTLLTMSQHPELAVNKIVSIGAPSRFTDFVATWTSFLHMPEKTVEQMRRKLVDRVGIPLERVTVENSVTQLQVDGLIIHDRQDHIVHYANAEAIAANWQQAQLITTEGLDHRGPLQDKQVIRQVVAFLQS